MTSRCGRLRLAAFLLFVGIGFLFVWGCGDDTSTGPGPEDPTRITMQLTAIVTVFNDPNNVLAGFIEVGDTISGTYIYDSTIENSYPADTTIGEYWHSIAPHGIFLETNGYEFKTDLNDVDFGIVIGNDLDIMGMAYDLYVVSSYNNEDMASDVAVGDIWWQIEDATGAALSSTELTTSPPDLADWTQHFGLEIWGFSISQPWQTYHFWGPVSEISKAE